MLTVFTYSKLGGRQVKPKIRKKLIEYNSYGYL
jgi:hypothetical protein